MNAAAEAFSVRHVCMFGSDVPEGMAALDDIVFGPHPLRSIPDRDPRRANVITFDVTPEGLRAVPRTQMQIIAGGLAVFLETGVSPAVRMMSAAMPSSFAGVCASTVTWLLSGGSLAFHHPFDAETLLSRSRTSAARRWSRLRRWRCGSARPARLPMLHHCSR